MVLHKSQPEPWQEALKLMNKCPICGNQYATESVKFFLRKENSSLVHSTCNSCSGSFVAMVAMLGRGVSSVGMVTDLTFNDVQRLYNLRPVAIDEVIDSHGKLNC